MLIEYKLKFGKKGLSITQRIESDSTGAQIKRGAQIKGNSLAASFAQSKAQNAAGTSGQGGGPSPKDVGGGPSPKDVGGDGEYGPSPKEIGGAGAGTGTGPITIIGPIILTCSPEAGEAISFEEIESDAEEIEPE